MFRTLKIKTSALLCAVFVFRLLFCNVNELSAAPASAVNVLEHNTTPAFQKKSTETETTIVSTSDKSFGQLIIQEWMENESDDDDSDSDHLKHTGLFVALHFLPKGFFSTTVQSGLPSDYLRCTLSLKKYLAISVLRI